MTNKHRLVLSNTYGHPNVGDEAILTSMIDGLSRSANVEISVLTLRPLLTQQKHPNVRVVESGVLNGIAPTVRAIAQGDLLIVGGGGIIQDQTSLANLLFHLSRPLAAYLSGIPFICYAIGVGPLRANIGRKLAATVLGKAQSITVRDTSSAKKLHQLGIAPELVQVTADPAMILDFPKEPSSSPSYKRIRALKRDANCIMGISLRPVSNSYRLLPPKPGQTSSSTWFLDKMIESVKKIIDEIDVHLVFFSMHPEQDDKLGLQLVEKVNRPDRTTFISGNLSPPTMMAIVGLTDLFIGMRLHALIFAARSAVPFIGLPYDPKIESFMRELNQESRMLPAETWTEGHLMNLVLDTWQHRNEIKDQILTQLPILQKRAKKDMFITIKALHRES